MTRRDDEHVENRHAFEPRAVREVESDIGGRDQQCGKRDRRREREPRERERDAQRDRKTYADIACASGLGPLRRMQAVGVPVAMSFMTYTALETSRTRRTARAPRPRDSHHPSRGRKPARGKRIRS